MSDRYMKYAQFQSGVPGEHFVSHIKVVYESILEQAKEETNAPVVIREGKDLKGDPDPNRVAVHSTCRRVDLSCFWRKYRELREQVKCRD